MIQKSTYNNKESEALGYQLPDNYFENFEKSILQKVRSNEMKEKHSTELGFDIPEGYFKKLEEEVLNKTVEKNKKTVVLKSFNWKLTLSIAATITLLLLVYNFFNWKPVSSNNIVLTNETLQNDALLNALFVDDSKLNDYVDSYVVNDLLIQDILTNFIDLDDTTLSLLFEKDSTIDTFMDDYVESLILEEIELN